MTLKLDSRYHQLLFSALYPASEASTGDSSGRPNSPPPSPALPPATPDHSSEFISGARIRIPISLALMALVPATGQSRWPSALSWERFGSLNPFFFPPFFSPPPPIPLPRRRRGLILLYPVAGIGTSDGERADGLQTLGSYQIARRLL